MNLHDNAMVWRRLLALLAVAAAAMVLVSGLQYAWNGLDLNARQAAATGSASPTPVGKATVSVSPTDKSKDVRPDGKVVVRAKKGRLTSVTVKAKDGRNLTGTYNKDRTRWTSKWAMSPDAHYKATAVAENSVQEQTLAKSKFTTLTPAAGTFQTTSYSLASDGSTVGVGFPIVLDFTMPIKDKKSVERALRIKMSKPVEGAWHWVNDTQVVFRPKSYWPAHEKIHVTAHTSGVHGGKDLFGGNNLSRTYTVGEHTVVKASSKTHQLAVYTDGKKVNGWPVSMGKGGVMKYFTTSGVHLTMGKSNPEQMISPGLKKDDPGYYDETIYYAVRISNSGEFVHSMPSTVSAQGRANVSHGCVNSPPQKAKWFYNHSLPGTPVTITGTPRPLEWNNGWGFWQKSWKSWKSGSALDRSINP